MTSECKHRSWQTVPMNGRKCNDCGIWLEEETAMTSELRPAVEVWRDADAAWDSNAYQPGYISIGASLDAAHSAAAAVIEADREAVRAYWYRQGKDDGWQCREEQDAELAKFKALAETLAGAGAAIIKLIGPKDCRLYASDPEVVTMVNILLQYKEATQ